MHRPWLAEKIARSEQYEQEDAEHRAMERAEFIQRMKTAKAKKKGGTV